MTDSTAATASVATHPGVQGDPGPCPREPTLRVVPVPADVNHNGDIFGGWIMAQVDVAGGMAAIRRAQGRVATVAVTSFTFKQPVMIGDIVSFYTSIVKTGRTSITVAVEVWAERQPHLGQPLSIVKVTEAELVYVAIGDDRRPRELPPRNAGEAA